VFGRRVQAVPFDEMKHHPDEEPETETEGEYDRLACLERIQTLEERIRNYDLAKQTEEGLPRLKSELEDADPKFIRMFDRKGYPVIQQDRFGKRYRVPLHVVKFGRLERSKRVLSEKQKANIVKAQAARKTKQVLLSSEDQNPPGNGFLSPRPGSLPCECNTRRAAFVDASATNSLPLRMMKPVGEDQACRPIQVTASRRDERVDEGPCRPAIPRHAVGKETTDVEIAVSPKG
jgi:hypothetical protein